MFFNYAQPQMVSEVSNRIMHFLSGRIKNNVGRNSCYIIPEMFMNNSEKSHKILNFYLSDIKNRFACPISSIFKCQ